MVEIVTAEVSITAGSQNLESTILNFQNRYIDGTAAATELILRRPELFRDYEITKGRMDDVFLAVTGRTLTGGAEK